MVVDFRPLPPVATVSTLSGLVEFVCYDGTHVTIDVGTFYDIKPFFYTKDGYQLIKLIRLIRMVRTDTFGTSLTLKNAKDIVEFLVGIKKDARIIP